MGPQPFSEPESQAVRDFVSSHTNLKVLLSYHTFSELILYPWGHTDASIGNERDHRVFTTMAQTMSRWNGYKPQQSSELYIASGDTTDWAYGTYGIFAFTFELTPKSMFGGGFYPGAGVIDSTFRANLAPALYLIDLADDPYRAIDQGPGASIWYK
jgi:carboxypeptidase T